MESKSKLLDYEPVTNPRSSNRSENYGFQSKAEGVAVTDFESNFNSNKWETSNDLRAKNIAASSHQILKRGHSLTFIGLFVFTFLLLFRPYEFSPSLSWLSKGALVSAIITLLVFIPTQLGLENSITVRTREINLVLFLLLLCLISVPFALDKLRAWYAFIEYLKVIIIFVVMVNVIRTKKQLKALLLLTLVATCVLAFAAINDYRAGNLSLKGVRIEGVIGGLFENPNDLAIHLVTFLPIIVVLALAAQNPIAKLLYFISAIATLAGTIVTFSRGGFLGLIFVIGALIWNFRRRSPRLVIAMFVLLIVSLLILVPGTYRERIATTGDGSMMARIGELKRSVFLTVRHPVFGVGLDNFVLFSDREQATHNSYTQIASEVGILGAVIYVLFLLTTLKRVRKVPKPENVNKKDRLLPYLAIGVQASVVGYMVTSFFASVAFLWYVYYLAAYGICISRLYESSVAAGSSLPPGKARLHPNAIPDPA